MYVPILGMFLSYKRSLLRSFGSPQLRVDLRQKVSNFYWEFFPGILFPGKRFQGKVFQGKVFQGKRFQGKRFHENRFQGKLYLELTGFQRL